MTFLQAYHFEKNSLKYGSPELPRFMQVCPDNEKIEDDANNARDEKTCINYGRYYCVTDQ